MATVDEFEQHVQRLVEMGATRRAWVGQFNKGEVAESVETVAALVLRRTDRQYAEFWGCFGVKEEEDAVEEPQRLPGQLLSLASRERIKPLAAATLDDVVGNDLDREPDAFTEVLRDTDRVLDRFVQDT